MDALELVRKAQEIIAAPPPNRFIGVLEAGDLPEDRLRRLAGEQYSILRSDRRSFALLASRFPEAPAGEMFLSLAAGENRALELLNLFAAALGWTERELRAYEPEPLAQAYPAYLAACAVYGSRSAIALAMLANLAEWGGYCARIADALRDSYDLEEKAVEFFRFFAEPPPGFTETATAVIQAGLDAGDDPAEALRAARLLHGYEQAFWHSLAQGLD